MQVFNKLKRSLSMASAILIGLSNFTPIIAEAQGAVSDVSTYKVIVENFTSYENQKPLKGATYDFNLVANKKADGSYEELSTPQKIASKTIGSADKEIFFETSKEGRYQVVQTSRPDGYYLGQGEFDGASKVAEVSFPLMENGLESTNKEVRLSPKFTKIVKSVEIQKLGENNDQLKDTTFTLIPGELNQNHDTDDEAVRTIDVKNNKLVLENLVEGKYTLQEKAAQDGYGLDNRPIDIEVSAPKDATSPDQVTVKLTRNNVEIQGLIINNYKVPTPGENSNGKPFDKLVKGPKDQGFVKKTKVGKGEEVQYKIDIDVPTDIKDYNKFVFYDKLDDALEFNPNTFKELNGVTSTPTPSEKYYSIAEAIKVKDNPDLTLVKFKGLDMPQDKADQVKEGGQVEITTTVKEGYKITKILVNGKEMTGNTFTLTKIPTNVEIVTEKIEQCTDLGKGWTNCDFTYEKNDEGKYEVTGFSEFGKEKVKTNKDLVIPSKDPQGNNITSVGKNAFQENQLTSVTIPQGIISIEWAAFYGNQLTSVIIPKGVISIDCYAFKHNQLISVIIPEGVISIKNGAFAENQLTSVTIPKSVTSIESNAFRSNQLTSVTIPKMLTSIESYAFADNKLTSVTISEGVTKIEWGAFADNKLTSVTISEGVTNIGDEAFANNHLDKVNIPSSLKNINSSNSLKNSFYNNLGIKGKVQLFTPDGTNPHNIKDNNYFVVNPQGGVRPASSMAARLFSFFKPIKANALEVEEGKEPIAVGTPSPEKEAKEPTKAEDKVISNQETYINSIDINNLGDNPNTFIKNGVLISYDPATKTIVGKIIDPKSFTDKHITVTFSARVLENKTIYNDVTVIYDNGKGSTGTPNLPEDKQPVVVGESGKITVKKIDGKTSDVLQGAEFKLMVKENDTWVDFNATTEGNTNATNAQGLLVFKDLPIREYKLIETKAPVIAGKTYNLTKEKIIIDLTKTAEVEQTVKNYDSETWIPRTGTLGMLPYILGAVILAGAGICLERKSKR